MNVEMQRAGVLGVQFDGAFERREDLIRAALRRRAVRLPVVPRLQVHQRVRVDDLDVGVLRELLGRVGHRVCERLVLGRTVAEPGVVARHDRRGEHPVAGCHRQPEGKPRRLGGAALMLLVHAVVEVRSKRVGLAPETGRAGRIGRLRGPERLDGRCVVEAPEERDAAGERLARLRVLRAGIEAEVAVAGKLHRGCGIVRRQCVLRVGNARGEQLAAPLRLVGLAGGGQKCRGDESRHQGRCGSHFQVSVLDLMSVAARPAAGRRAFAPVRRRRARSSNRPSPRCGGGRCHSSRRRR